MSMTRFASLTAPTRELSILSKQLENAEARVDELELQLRRSAGQSPAIQELQSKLSAMERVSDAYVSTVRNADEVLQNYRKLSSQLDGQSQPSGRDAVSSERLSALQKDLEKVKRDAQLLGKDLQHAKQAMPVQPFGLNGCTK